MGRQLEASLSGQSVLPPMEMCLAKPHCGAVRAGMQVGGLRAAEIRPVRASAHGSQSGPGRPGRAVTRRGAAQQAHGRVA